MVSLKNKFTGKKITSITKLTGLSLTVILIFLSAGCSNAGLETAPTSIPSSTEIIIVPSSTPFPTHSPSPTSTPLPTVTPTETPIPTATPIPFPMSILAARQASWPGSTVTIDQTLAPGANYSRYIAWYESEGLKIYGLLTIPNGDMPSNGWPALVFDHGYIPPTAYRTTERYINYVDQLARHGYIVFKIDYRGHDRSQGEARGAYGDPGYTTDVLNAIASLKTFPQADPHRLGAWGHSMGGFLTLRAMVISTDLKAGVIWSGVVGSYPDLLCCWKSIPPWWPALAPNPDLQVHWRDVWQAEFGTPEENPEFWRSISANSYLAELSGPLQLHHDSWDSQVPVEFSQDLYQQTLSAGKTVEYYEYPGDDHDIANYFSLAMQRTIEFFDKYVKGGG